MYAATAPNWPVALAAFVSPMTTAATSWIADAGREFREILKLILEQGKLEAAVLLAVFLTAWIFWCRRPRKE